MITAKETAQLTKQKIASILKFETQEVQRDIKGAARAGHDFLEYLCHPSASATIAEMLKDADFTVSVEQSDRRGHHDRLTIEW